MRPGFLELFPARLGLAHKHSGVWGGCHCSYFHGDTERTVKSEYGSPVELPRIHHRKEHDAGEAALASWRITCVIVDRDHRRSAVAREALEGALDLIAQAGGGEVISFPSGPVCRRLTLEEPGPDMQKAPWRSGGFSTVTPAGFEPALPP